MPRKRTRKRLTPNRASDATIELRVQAILQIILDGAESWDILQYVAQKQEAKEPPWNDNPVKERQIREYITRAKERIVAAGAENDADLLRHHMAKRRNLYARAVQAGDNRTALAILSDMARLQDLYPAAKEKHEHTGELKIRIEADDDFYNNAERLAENTGNRLASPAPDAPPAPGTE